MMQPSQRVSFEAKSPPFHQVWAGTVVFSVTSNYTRKEASPSVNQEPRKEPNQSGRIRISLCKSYF